MGRTHEALRRAEETYRQSRGGIPAQGNSPERIESGLPSLQDHPGITEQCYREFKRNLLSGKETGSRKSISFIPVDAENGSSVYAFEFASFLAKDPHLRVLFVDMNLWTLSFQEVFEKEQALGGFDLFGEGDKTVSSIRKTALPNLFLVRWCGDPSESVNLFQSGEFDRFLDNVKERFDHIVLSTPPISAYWKFRVICSKADRVVPILSDRRLADQIVQASSGSAQLLGVIVHKGKENGRRAWPLRSGAVLLLAGLVFGLGFYLGTAKMGPGGPRNSPAPMETSRQEAAVVHGPAEADVLNFPVQEPPKTAGGIVSRMLKEQTGLAFIPLTQTYHETKSSSVQETPQEGRLAGPEIQKSLREDTGLEPRAHPERFSLQEKIAPPPSPKVASSKGGKTLQVAVRSGPEISHSLKGPLPEKGEDLRIEAHSKKVHPATIPPAPQAVSTRTRSLGVPQKERTVVVSEGDTLYRIIRRSYGKYDEKILKAVLARNPKLKSPDQIVVGQKLRLPPPEGSL